MRIDRIALGATILVALGTAAYSWELSRSLWVFGALASLIFTRDTEDRLLYSVLCFANILLYLALTFGGFTGLSFYLIGDAALLFLILNRRGKIPTAKDPLFILPILMSLILVLAFYLKLFRVPEFAYVFCGFVFLRGVLWPDKAQRGLYDYYYEFISLAVAYYILAPKPEEFSAVVIALFSLLMCLSRRSIYAPLFAWLSLNFLNPAFGVLGGALMLAGFAGTKSLQTVIIGFAALLGLGLIPLEQPEAWVTATVLAISLGYSWADLNVKSKFDFEEVQNIFFTLVLFVVGIYLGTDFSERDWNNHDWSLLSFTAGAIAVAVLFYFWKKRFAFNIPREKFWARFESFFYERTSGPEQIFALNRTKSSGSPINLKESYYLLIGLALCAVVAWGLYLK